MGCWETLLPAQILRILELKHWWSQFSKANIEIQVHDKSPENISFLLHLKYLVTVTHTFAPYISKEGSETSSKAEALKAPTDHTQRSADVITLQLHLFFYCVNYSKENIC